MTAREIAYALGYKDLNAVKPRLTEMRDVGIVEPAGCGKDPITKIIVTILRLTNAAYSG